MAKIREKLNMTFNEVKFLKRFKEELAAHYNKHHEVQGTKSKPRKKSG